MKKKRIRDCCSFWERTNFLLKMKLLSLLMFVSIASVTANSYSQQTKFNMNVEGISVKDAFQEIEAVSEYIFIYSEDNVDLDRKVNIRVENKPVSTILDEILKGTDNYYEIQDRQVVILSRSAEEDQKSILSLIDQQQGHPVKGMVTDQSGLPLPGATVYVKGTNAGVVTNAYGKYEFSVKVNPDHYLVFSFIGMKKQEIKVGNQDTINVVLEEDTYAVDDVTVIGAYGTIQKKSDMVGSAYQMGAEQIKNRPATRVDLLLDGVVPGLKIEPNTDSPSTTRTRYNTRIRGTASLSASNEPLWILDGTPIYTGGNTNLIPGVGTSISPLASLNPEDIESITVLKDATATSIYGANGANGVILITTKKGKKGKSSLQFHTRYGVSQIDQSTKVKVLSGTQYMELAKEAYANAGLDMAYFPFQDNDLNQYSTTAIDWSDTFYGLGSNKLADISLRGGSEKATYFISGAYYNENQTVKGNTTDRYSFRANNDINVTDKLTATFNLSTSYSVDDIFNMGTDYYDFLPINSPYYSDGSFRLYNKYIDGKNLNGDPNWIEKKFFNSVAEREENDYQQRVFVSNINIILNYKILKGLQVTSQLGMDYQSRYENQYKARTNWSGMDSDGEPKGYSSRSHFNSLVVTNINRLNFEKEFGRHKVAALGGMEINSKTYKTVSASGSGFVNDHIKEISYAVDQDGSSSAYIDHALSFFGQVNYSFDNRYYLSLNARRDGNSMFGKDVSWGNFGSIGYSWNIHNESFFNSKIINILKFKTSFGTNGNSRLGHQEALGIYSYNESHNYIDEGGTAMTRSPQPTLSWETTYMANIGLRIKLFDRLDIDAEWYNNKTVDLLTEMDVSRTTGSPQITRNVGSIRNRGYEATISVDWIKQENLHWNTSINLAHNKNKLLKLYEGIEKTVGTKLWRVGEGIDTYYLVRWAGVDPRDGAPLWYDKTGNVTRTYSYDNRVADKSSTPDLTGGITNSVGYGNFELSMLFNYEIGGYAFSSFARNVSSDGLNIMSQNQSVNQLDRWQEPGDIALNPKPIWGVSTKSVMNSTRFLYEKTNLRLQNVALTYQVQSNMIKRWGIQNCRLSLIGDNLGLWTRYDKKDRNSYRQSMRGYPMERTFSLSLDLTF